MEGAVGKELRGPGERGAVLSSSIQKLRPWVLRKKEREGRPETKGKGEAGHTAAKDHQGSPGAGQGRVQENTKEGKKRRPDWITCLIFCALQSWKEGKEKKMKK